MIRAFEFIIQLYFIQNKGTLPHPPQQRASLSQLTMPQIPDPDYSLSESDDDDDENSVLLAHNTKMNEHIPVVPAETSGNSNNRYICSFFFISTLTMHILPQTPNETK